MSGSVVGLAGDTLRTSAMLFRTLLSFSLAMGWELVDQELGFLCMILDARDGNNNGVVDRDDGVVLVWCDA